MIEQEAYQYGGMHLFWWIIWMFFIFWVFATPYRLPGQNKKYNTPLDILKKRLALGEINQEEYQEKKKLIES